MPQKIDEITERINQANGFVPSLFHELEQIIVGQKYLTERLVLGLLTGEHILLEGVPGLAKTTAVKTLAQSVKADFKRIQFTPDLLPADLLGTQIYQPKTGEFSIKKGPLFANIILADEINRAPAKVQASLLEAMQERQVTLGEETTPLPAPFMVLATQNPLDQEGTYPLPEAELDRFLFKVLIDYPDHADETRLVNMVLDGTIRASLDVESLTPVTDAAGLKAMKTLSDSVLIDDEVLDYALRIVRATRDFSGLSHGASPRASIALARASRVQALFEGRDFVTPDDVQQVARPVLRHRIQLSADAEIEGQTPETALGRLLEQVEAPKQ